MYKMGGRWVSWSAVICHFALCQKQIRLLFYSSPRQLSTVIQQQQATIVAHVIVTSPSSMNRRKFISERFRFPGPFFAGRVLVLIGLCLAALSKVHFWPVPSEPAKERENIHEYKERKAPENEIEKANWQWKRVDGLLPYIGPMHIISITSSGEWPGQSRPLEPGDLLIGVASNALLHASDIRTRVPYVAHSIFPY